MNLNRIIESAEKQYKQILEEYFISVYSERSLSSHGIEHHRRVWKYSAELLKVIPLKKKLYPKLTTDLLIASYLHDIGMSVDPGLKHGKYSKDLCARFLALNNLSINDYMGVLEAIENHDNKEYINVNKNDLLTLLSVADDLDAFGFTGIYRYAEIYLIRETDLKELGLLINKNAGKRFENFVKTVGKSKKLIEKHIQRYQILDNFFNKYNEQLPYYQFGTLNPLGYCGVIELFGKMISNKMEPKELIFSEMNNNDPIINWFFSELAFELLVEHKVL
jgi:HD superfamily phosphodiesterase